MFFMGSAMSNLNGLPHLSYIIASDHNKILPARSIKLIDNYTIQLSLL